MTATCTQVLNSVRHYLGYIETPVNITDFGAWYGLQGASWCDMFLSFSADQAGAGDIIGKFAYTPSHARWFKERGQFDQTPSRGAVVFFQWPEMNRICHVGIVESVRPDGRIVTLEGNTSSGDAGSQRNGGGVYRRVRATTYVAGYGHPTYGPEVAVSRPAVPPASRDHVRVPAPRHAPIVVDGVWGKATTIRFQALRGLPINGVLDHRTKKSLQTLVGAYPDGVWGPKTRRAFQRWLHVNADGQWGPVTIKAFQRRLNTFRLK